MLSTNTTLEILLVCRVIHDEASPTFISSTSFSFVFLDAFSSHKSRMRSSFPWGNSDFHYLRSISLRALDECWMIGVKPLEVYKDFVDSLAKLSDNTVGLDRQKGFNQCRFTIHIDPIEQRQLLGLRSGFIKAVKKLKMFCQVVLWFKASGTCVISDLAICHPMMENFCAALSKDLGNGIKKGTFDYERLIFTEGFEFRPLEYAAQKNNRETCFPV